jgi:predicted DNA-binding transcriptional regulator AlpA
MPDSLRASLAVVGDLERLASAIPLEDAPSLLGDLERVRWSLRLRLEMFTRGRENSAATEPNRLLDVEEAAGRLGCSPSWLYRHSKRLPFVVRTGRSLRFSSKAIDYFIRSRETRKTIVPS